MVRKFKRDISALSNIFKYIESALTYYRLSKSSVYFINLAVEELFTNMVKYNRCSNSDITIVIKNDENKINVELIDPHSDEFDFNKIQDVDITKRLEEREVGGLGLHLVKKIVENLEYHYSNGESRITFTLNLEKNNV